MFACGMHQPVEWDFTGLLPDILAADVPEPQHQQHQDPLSQHMVTFPSMGSWNASMHQPISPSPPQLQMPTVVPAPSVPQSVQPPLPVASSAPATQPRESVKRERAVRRTKSTTLRPQQQQMLELQKKLDVLLQEHAVVEAENERLKTRLRVLEAVLPVREQQARWAQSRPSRATKTQPDPVLANLLDMASGPSSCATSPARLETGGCANGRSAAPEDVAVVRKPHELVAGSPAPAPISEAAPCASSSSDNPNSCAAGAGVDQAAASIPGPHPHSESEARWLDAWRGWVREAALLVHAYDARPNDHYLRRLEDAFVKLKAEVVYLGLKHPELVCNMRCVNLETGAEQEIPPDSYWNLVAAGMRLSSTQVANCKSALAMYRERMEVVLAERRGLTAQLASCLGAMQLGDDVGRTATGSLRREQLMVEVEEVTAALDANVASEGHTTALARDLLGSSLFSRLQTARACVLSYPYFPDALAIITAAVAESEPAGPKGSEGATLGQSLVSVQA